MGVRRGDKATTMAPELSSNNDDLVTALIFLVLRPSPLRVSLARSLTGSRFLSNCDSVTYSACRVDREIYV